MKSVVLFTTHNDFPITFAESHFSRRCEFILAVMIKQPYMYQNTTKAAMLREREECVAMKCDNYFERDI